MFGTTLSGLLEASDSELDARIRELELQRRQVESELAGAIAVADARVLYAADGHRSMAAYLRSTCNWSNGEVARLRGASKLVNAHPAVGDAWAEGRIGSSQVTKLSMTHGNTRVTDRLGEFIPTLLDSAEQLPHAEFVEAVDHFVNFADVDGTHDNRDAVESRTAQAVEVGGELNMRVAGGTPLEAAEFLAIFDRFVDREFQIELDQRREMEAVAAPDVAFPELRTLSQRRFDAVMAMARAADAHIEADGTFHAAEPLVSILVDQQSWSWVLAHSGLGAATSLGGDSIDPFTGLPIDNTLLDDLLGDPASLADRRCVTTNGVTLRPDDVLRAALAGKMRRVVLGAKRRPIDLGRAERVFTGAARDAAKLLVAWCEHPGCDLPAELCQVDHSVEWYEMGPTDQANAGVRCSGHNREKHRTKRRVRRSAAGRNYTIRPDGTIILPVGCRPPHFDDDDHDDDCGDAPSNEAVPDLNAFFARACATPEDERRLTEAARSRAALLTA